MSPRRLRTHLGFSLIEVMISASLFLVAITGIISAVSTAGLVRTNARMHGEATELAEEQMELLLAEAQGAPALASGVTHEERKQKDGTLDAAGPFLVRWTVAPLLSVPSVSRVAINVSWQTSTGQNRSLTMETNRD
jgi:Tfp pilus assembly protein PilV